MDVLLVIVLVLALGVVLLGYFLVFSEALQMALQARLAGVPIPLMRLVSWKVRWGDLRTIVLSAIRLRKASVGVSHEDLADHYFAGGRVPNCVAAIIRSREHGLDTRWEEIAAWDLEGIDVLKEVNDIIEQPQS